MSLVSWLVVGIGDITTKRVLPAILAEPRSRLAGIVTHNPAKAAPYGVESWTNLDDALAHSGANAVYVATPVFLHAPHVSKSEPGVGTNQRRRDRPRRLRRSYLA